MPWLPLATLLATQGNVTSALTEALEHKVRAEELAETDPLDAEKERELAMAMLRDVQLQLSEDPESSETLVFKVDVHLAEVYCAAGKLDAGQELLNPYTGKGREDEQVLWLKRVQEACGLGLPTVSDSPVEPEPPAELAIAPLPPQPDPPERVPPAGVEPAAPVVPVEGAERNRTPAPLGAAVLGAGVSVFAYAVLSEVALAEDVGVGEVGDAEWDRRQTRTNVLYASSYGLMAVGGTVWVVGRAGEQTAMVRVSGSW